MTPVPTDEFCVYCRKRPLVHEWRPFCSERCKLLDLARWAEGSYRAPGDPAAAPEQEDRPREDAS